MQVLQQLPPIPLRRRIVRGFTTLAGFLLTTAGIITGSSVLFIVLIIVLTLIKGSNPSNIFKDAGLFFIIAAITSAACLFFGRKLMRGKRRLVLFLRRFGFHQASQALTFAVSSAFGRRWRLVTLDDAEIAPMGVPPGKRRLAQIGRWLFLGVLLIAVLYALVWFFGGEPKQIINELFDNMFNKAKDRGDNPFSAFIGAFFGTLVAGLVILAFIFSFLLIGVSLSASAALFSWNTWRQVRKAERSKALSIVEENRIAAILTEVINRTKRIFAARLTVLRVSGKFWQEVVRRLVMSADAIVVDISEPSDNLLWEIATLEENDGVTAVYVGQLHKVKELITDQSLGDGPDHVMKQLKELLKDKEVLVYESEPKGAMRKFAGNLAAYLEVPAFR